MPVSVGPTSAKGSLEGGAATLPALLLDIVMSVYAAGVIANTPLSDPELVSIFS